MGAKSDLLAGDAGDVKYPHHLINGRVPQDPDVYKGKPDRRVRMRVVNAGSDTAYCVALGGHKLTITHTDGFRVRHREVDALLLGMGERYDVLVTLKDGAFPLVALAEGTKATGFALVRTGPGHAPAPTVRPKELDGAIVTASGESGPRKDTAIVLPKTKLSVFFDADSPGQWMLHCYNAYHGEAGTMANVAYRA